MALLGLIIASLVNLFLKNTMLDFVLSALGVLVFTGLIAYDTQKIRALAETLSVEEEMHESRLKIALLGALTLYLDFLNLFLSLLRFLGKKRD